MCFRRVAGGRYIDRRGSACPSSDCLLSISGVSKKLRAEQRLIHERFCNEFEKRKQAIGKIVCPQCKWTGNWGDGMSYQEFFAYELVKYEVGIDEMLIRDANNLSNEAQYKCPMCKSTNWQKV